MYGHTYPRPAVLAMLLATGLLIAASFVLGQAIVLLCGWPPLQWWAPALGFGCLMILFGQLVRMRGDQLALVVVAVVAVAAALALPAARRASRDAAADALVLGAGATLLAAIPFFAAGYAGVLGASVSNDMSQHLTGAYWLGGGEGVLPVAAIGGDLITTGYPLGPHGLAAALGDLGLGEVRAFSALTLAVPALTAFAAFGLVPSAPRTARIALAAAVGLGYLLAAFLAQGLFKETILAMLILAATVALGDLAAGERGIAWRRAIPFGLFAAASVYTYSYGGLLWLGAVVGLFLAVEVLRRRELFSVARRFGPGAIAATVTAVVLVLPEADRVRAFRNSIFGQESLANKGNLAHALNPLEVLGVWFSGDFRFNPDPRWPTYAFCALALVALAGGLVWWWRRRALALPVAVVAAVIVWIQLVLTINIYNQAKGLVMLAPLVMACIGAPLAAAWGGLRHRWSRAARAAGVVLLAGVVVSTGGVLRSAPVGLGSRDAEFAEIRPLVRDKAVLFLDNDHFGQWQLRGAKPLYTTNNLYAPDRLTLRKAKERGALVDVDNYGGRELDRVDYIVVAGGRYRSQIPPNFRLALQTASYEVFERRGPTAARTPIDPPSQPGAVLECDSELVRRHARDHEWAGVVPGPVVRSDWRGSIARPGGEAWMTVTLPRGRWDLSLQYLSATPVSVRAPGLAAELAPNFGLITAFWPAGSVTSDGRPFRLTVKAAERTWFARLLGRPRPMRAALAPGLRPLWGAAFTRRGATPRRIPLREACGRYVDWLAQAR